MTSGEAAGGPLDVPTLGAMGRRAASHRLVDDWSLRPDALSPRHLEVRFDEAQYPEGVDAARLDVRWYEGGQYTVHYVEARRDGRWQCRWDRHPKPGEPEIHFHPPPDASSDVEPSPVDRTHHLDVLFAVLDWIDDRVTEIHPD